jgi:hypothetical protein
MSSTKNLRGFTVLGVYLDPEYERFASYVLATDADEAARKVEERRGDDAVVAGVVAGHRRVLDTEDGIVVGY